MVAHFFFGGGGHPVVLVETPLPPDIVAKYSSSNTRLCGQIV